jgi:hypothetical protein
MFHGMLGLVSVSHISNDSKTDYSGFEKIFSANFGFNGGFTLSPKWMFQVNGFYDFDTNELQLFTMNISRDMHCWQMSISITP